MNIAELINHLNERDYETDIALVIKEDKGYLMELYCYMSGHHKESEVLSTFSIDELKNGEAGRKAIRALDATGVFKKIADRYIEAYLAREVKLTEDKLNEFKNTDFHDWDTIDLNDEKYDECRKEIGRFLDIVNENITITGMDKYDIEYYKNMKEQFIRGSEPLVNKMIDEINGTIKEYEEVMEARKAGYESDKDKNGNIVYTRDIPEKEKTLEVYDIEEEEERDDI